MKKPSVAVIDYGMGNLRSVGKAFEAAGAKITVTNDPKKILSAQAVVFPGVGSFGHALKNIKKYRLQNAIKEVISSGKPFLGLCLGFQLLFDSSTEDGKNKGLGVIPGCVERFNFKSRKLKVPHMGWNRVSAQGSAAKAKMFKGIKDNSYFYFVHSYYGIPKSKEYVSSLTDYGTNFCSSVIKGKVWACQFHPEKSGDNGLKIIKNFLNEVSEC